MKIIIVGYSTSVGGAEKRMISFSNFCSTNNEVFLVTFKSGNKNFSNTLNKSINHINLNSNINYTSILKLYKLLKQVSPDKVYGFLGHINIVLGFLKIFFPNTIFIGRENATYEVYFREKGKKSVIIKMAYKTFLKKLDIIIAQSNYMKNDLVALFNIPKNKIFVLKNPIPEIKKIEKDDFIFDDSKKYLLSVGRLERVKNQIDMIKVLPLLPNNYELILVGEGTLHNELKSTAISLNLDNRVHFIGYTKNVGYYYKNSNLLLLTSFRETSPNVVLEATFYELFSVTYNMPGGINDLIQKGTNGFIICQNNPNYLAKAIMNNIDKKATFDLENLYDEKKYNEIILGIGG